MTNQTHIALMDNHSGLISWQGMADDAAHAVMQCMDDIGEARNPGEFVSYNPHDTRSGFHVFELPENAAECEDGQDQEHIDYIEEIGVYKGFIELI